MFYWFVKGIFYPFVRLYLGLSREGLENVPRRGPVIMVSNHASYMDAFLLGTASPRPIHFIVLQRMYDIFLLRWFYWGMGTIPVSLGGRDSRAIRRSMALLSTGRVLGIFPEGRRSEDGTIGQPRPGVALIAALSGAPVVPAYIDGARESLPVGGRFPAPARVHVRFGPALRFEPLGQGRRNRAALDDFAGAIDEAIRSLRPVP